MPDELAVVIDGATLPDVEARAFWKRFSEHMETHKGDLAGFAAAEGLASVHPEARAGGPVLVGSRTAPQRAYVSAPDRSGPAANARGTRAGGSRRPHSGARSTRSGPSSAPKKPDKSR